VKAEAEAAFYKQQYEALQKPQQQPTPQGEPQPKDFKDWESYQAALIDYRVEQRFTAREQESQTQRQQREAQQHAQSVKAKLAQGAEEFSDFEEVAYNQDVPITQPMAHAIAESEIPAKVAYYLGSHLDEATRISNLPPTQQVREIAKLEAKLIAPPKPTQTPPPIVPNKANATAETGYRPDMSDKQFAEWRKRHNAQRDR
jgi:hypothetical protein